MDLKRAYEIMELDEGRSIEEVEKRFDILVRRMRKNHGEEGADGAESVVHAYKTIKDFEREASVDKLNVARFGTNTKKQARSEKWEHFWNHHRWKVFAGIGVIVIIIIVTNIVISNIKEANLPTPALGVMMYGDYYGPSDDDLSKALLTKFPDWKRIKGIVNYLPSANAGGGDQSAYVQKSFVILATEHPDVYILDKTTFATMLSQGVLSNMDALRTQLAAVHSADQLLMGKQTNDIKEKKVVEADAHLYGVDVTNDPIWKTLGVPQNQKIAVLIQSLKNPDNAKRFLLTLDQKVQ